MKRSSTAMLATAVILALSGIAIFSWYWYGQKNKAALGLGEMPAVSTLPDQLQRQVASEMRDWIEDMAPSNVKTLKDTGHVVFYWNDLKAADPQRAALIDNYVEQQRKGFEKAAIDQNKTLPPQLSVHHNPDSVEFEKTGPGKYRVAIRSKEGVHASYLDISARTPNTK